MTFGPRLWEQHARADLPSLSWSAPAGCPDNTVVRQRIADWLGKPDALGAPDAPVRASGVVTRSRGGYKLTLTVTEGGVSGTRRLVGKDCQQLSDTAAFLIAVSSDPNAASSAPPPVRAPAPPPAVPEEPEAQPTPAPASAPATPPAPGPVPPHGEGPWSLHGAGFGGLWQDNLPALQALAGGSLGAAYGIWHAELRGAYAFQRKELIANTRRGGVARASTQSYGLATCALWQVGPLRGGPCATLSLLLTRAGTDNVTVPGDVHKLWSVFGLGAQVAIQLVRHLELFGEGGATVPVAGLPVFTLDGKHVLTAATVAYYGWLGARIRWGLAPRAKP